MAGKPQYKYDKDERKYKKKDGSPITYKRTRTISTPDDRFSDNVKRKGEGVRPTGPRKHNPNTPMQRRRRKGAERLRKEDGDSRVPPKKTTTNSSGSNNNNRGGSNTSSNTQSGSSNNTNSNNKGNTQNTNRGATPNNTKRDSQRRDKPKKTTQQSRLSKAGENAGRAVGQAVDRTYHSLNNRDHVKD